MQDYKLNPGPDPEVNRLIIHEYLKAHGYPLWDPKAALVDMDGTLYDSMGNHADAWVRMAREEGFDVSRDEFFMYEGRTGASTINILYNRKYGHNAPEDEVKRLYAKKSQYFQELPKVVPMPGAPMLMDFLHHKGFKIVLVTGSGQSSLISRLDSDYPGIFLPDMRITAANTDHSKPHPDPYLKAMALAGMEPWQAIALENAPMGVESAARSGAFTVAVTTGPIPREAMAQAGATIIYDSMEQCAKCFPQLLLSYIQQHR